MDCISLRLAKAIDCVSARVAQLCSGYSSTTEIMPAQGGSQMSVSHKALVTAHEPAEMICFSLAPCLSFRCCHASTVNVRQSQNADHSLWYPRLLTIANNLPKIVGTLWLDWCITLSPQMALQGGQHGPDVRHSEWIIASYSTSGVALVM